MSDGLRVTPYGVLADLRGRLASQETQMREEAVAIVLRDIAAECTVTTPHGRREDWLIAVNLAWGQTHSMIKAVELINAARLAGGNPIWAMQALIGVMKSYGTPPDEEPTDA